jgi:hypothetical protein
MGNQSRVVNLHTRNAMCYQHPTPLFVKSEAVGEESKPLFEKSGGVVCVLRGKAIAIAINRAGTGIPKLCNIL